MFLIKDKKDWLVYFNPKKKSKFQSLIKNPTDMKGPVGGREILYLLLNALVLLREQ